MTKKLFIILILAGIFLLAGCSSGQSLHEAIKPDRATIGFIYLDADFGPFKVSTPALTGGLEWDL